MNPFRIRNIYNCSIGEFPQNVTVDLLKMNVPDNIKILMESDTWVNACKKRENSVPDSYSNFDYCIVSVNDRASANIKKIKETLISYRFHDLQYFMATDDNVNEFLNERSISIDWRPEYSFDRQEPFVGEFGIFGSQILVLEHMVKNNIQEMIVFEDDVELTDKFIDYLNLCHADLPKDYDFLADATIFPNDRELNNIKQQTIIQSEYICKSYLQNAHLGFMMYSLAGAKKILSLMKEIGFFAPMDSMLFHYSRTEQLTGYTTIFANRLISNKDMLGSLIDEHGVRR